MTILGDPQSWKPLSKQPENEQHLVTMNAGLVHLAKINFDLTGDPLKVIYFLMGRILQLEKQIEQSK